MVGTSIWLMNALSCQKSMAIQAVGANTATMKKRLEGMWVNTMVLRSPILLASLAATHMEMAVRIWDRKNTWPSCQGSRPNLVLNQAAIRLWWTIDVVKVSTLNNPVRVKMIRRDGSLRGLVHCRWVGAPSTAGERRLYNRAPTSWNAAKARNITLYEEMALSPKLSW